MEQTTFLKIFYPSENENPFWEIYQKQMEGLDSILFMQKLMGNMFMSAGGTRTWNGGTGLFSWTQDFKVPVYHYGKVISIVYGNDNITRSVGLQDGECLYIEVPATINANLSMNFKKAAQLDVKKHNQLVLAYRMGASLYLKGIGEIN